ncbi:MAG TPA: endolytic transglycosylase MltG [Candidatus Limnocylindrales bacterium]
MMLDDLQLGYEPEPPQRKRSVVAFVVGLLLLVVLAFGVFLGYQGLVGAFRTPDYAGTGTAEKVEVEIKPGATQVDIAKVLAEADVIKSPKAFVDAGVDNDEALRIQPGFYRLPKRMSGDAAVLALLDPQNRIVRGVLIREGLVTVEIYKLLAEELGRDVGEFEKAAQDPVKLGVPEWWFNRKDGTSTDKRSVEGFLFPATYEFAPHTSAEQALSTMVRKFLTVTGGLDFAERVQKDRNISPYEALIGASIVESEVQTPADMGKAARAVYNRVYTDRHDCRCLQLDAAINYYFKISGEKAKDPNEFRMSEIHNPDNPYNTHIRPGMPVSPISNPGENALNAAMDTPVGDWLYWVTVDTKGTTLFADNYEGHLANIKLACKNGVLTGELC